MGHAQLKDSHWQDARPPAEIPPDAQWDEVSFVFLATLFMAIVLMAALLFSGPAAQ